MSKKLLIATAAASLMALTACGTNPTNAQIGTATGAVLGGAAAGAVIGNEVGKRQDQKR